MVGADASKSILYLTYFLSWITILSLLSRIRISDYEIALCSLPGDRMGGARRSLAADLGEKHGKYSS